MTTTAYYKEYVPTPRDKIKRWLGYEPRHRRFDEDPAGCPYWAMTTVRIRFSFLDRLRLVLTGAVNLQLEHRTDVEIKEMHTITSVQILAPGDVELRHRAP